MGGMLVAAATPSLLTTSISRVSTGPRGLSGPTCRPRRRSRQNKPDNHGHLYRHYLYLSLYGRGRRQPHLLPEPCRRLPGGESLPGQRDHADLHEHRHGPAGNNPDRDRSECRGNPVLCRQLDGTDSQLMNVRLKKNKAFSLIELMVSILILSIGVLRDLETPQRGPSSPIRPPRSTPRRSRSPTGDRAAAGYRLCQCYERKRQRDRRRGRVQPVLGHYRTHGQS